MTSAEPRPASTPNGFEPLLRARRVVVGLTVLGLLALLVAFLVPRFGRGERERTAAWVRALDLHQLAIAPAGTPARDPASVLPGVPLRHTPGLPTGR